MQRRDTRTASCHWMLGGEGVEVQAIPEPADGSHLPAPSFRFLASNCERTNFCSNQPIGGTSRKQPWGMM